MKRATRRARGWGPHRKPAGRPAGPSLRLGARAGARHHVTASRGKAAATPGEAARRRPLRPPSQRSPPTSSAAPEADDAAAADRAVGRGLRRPGVAEATRRSAPPAVQ